MPTPVARLLQQAAEHAGRGDYPRALSLCDDALLLDPADAAVHLNRSVVLHRMHRHADAAQEAEAACRLRPDWAEAWANAGHLRFAHSEFAEAAHAFTRAAGIDVANAGYPFNAGRAWEKLQAWSRAATAYRAAYDRAPANGAIWEACDRLLTITNRPDDAAALFADHVGRPATATLATSAPSAPSAPSALSGRLVAAGLLYARMLADPALEARCLAEALARDWQPVELPALLHALSLMQYHDVPRERLLELYVRANALRQANRRGDVFRVRRRLARADRIRVGYLSADFRRHPMGQLMADIVRCHDKARFELHLFSVALPGNEDSLTAELRRLAHSFDVLTPLGDLAAAERIASHELDLVVDLMSLSAYARSGILLHKPAPVIATHLGYHGPIALEQVDYKITDAYADPPVNAAYQIERALPLATCVLPFRRVSAAPGPDTPTRAALGIPADAIVCAEFVGPNKLSPR